MKLNEVNRIDFTPRAYQLELIEAAQERNIIVPLGTGSGKTFIAVMLIKEMAADLRLPYDEGGMRSFFVVDKVALVAQQAEHIRAHTDLHVGEYHGQLNVDKWAEGEWQRQLCENEVFVLTAQVLVDMLNHGYFSLQRANVLVFDECHHILSKRGGGGHAYAKIMDVYNNMPKGMVQRADAHINGADARRPRVLALTASLISTDVHVDALVRSMDVLERALDATIVTASDMANVCKYGAQPQKAIVHFDAFIVRHDPPLAAVIAYLQRARAYCRRCSFDP